MRQTEVVRDRMSREPFVVVALPAPLAVGERVSRRAWPAHVTLASNFVVEGTADAVVSAVRRVCAGERPLKLRFGDAAWFGPRQDIAVQLVDSARILALHARLADSLEALDGFAPDGPGYWREGYRPHMTHVPGVATPAGTSAQLPFVAVAVMPGATATVVATTLLEEDARGS
ncbi:2'-5' RNA ligase superfamily protein [Microbacterium kyungheense]|uniref:2'-5' RNA ligase superfamily protein n=1 Tax=Microbacterium kyungheense TaxID=1263636 RepID=A0A543F3F7_9MICO|nr:2'-5' RNA ligase superfamily protein [Microbacterium kyungheense]